MPPQTPDENSQKFLENYKEDIPDKDPLTPEEKVEVNEFLAHSARNTGMEVCNRKGIYIPLEEVTAVREYTGQLYDRLNEALRKGFVDKLGKKFIPPKYSGMAKILNNTLNRIAPTKGDCYRFISLEEEELAQYKEGVVIQEDAFCSTTAVNDQYFYKKLTYSDAINTRFIIHGSSGRNISALAAFSDEQEVLFKSGTKFKVGKTKHVEYGHPFTEIELIEVEEGGVIPQSTTKYRQLPEIQDLNPSKSAAMKKPLTLFQRWAKDPPVGMINGKLNIVRPAARPTVQRLSKVVTSKVENVNGVKIFVDPSRDQIKVLSDMIKKRSWTDDNMIRLMRNHGIIYMWDGMEPLAHIVAVRQMALPGITETRLAFPDDLDHNGYNVRDIFNFKSPADYDIELGEDGRARVLGGFNVRG